jgi:hypothetical protein
MTLMEHIARTGGMKNAYNTSVGKPERKRPLGRPRRRRVDNTNTDLRELAESVDWMHLAQDRDQCRALVNTIMNLRFP